MRNLTRLALLSAVVAFGVNCGGGGNEPDVPKPGALSVALTTPNIDDAAIKLTLTSPVAPTAIAAASAGLRLFVSGTIGTTTTVVVTGDMTAGPILTLTVPDTRAVGDYSAAVVQVASTTYALRANTGYALSVDK